MIGRFRMHLDQQLKNYSTKKLFLQRRHTPIKFVDGNIANHFFCELLIRELMKISSHIHDAK